MFELRRLCYYQAWSLTVMHSSQDQSLCKSSFEWLYSCTLMSGIKPYPSFLTPHLPILLTNETPYTPSIGHWYCLRSVKGFCSVQYVICFTYIFLAEKGEMSHHWGFKLMLCVTLQNKMLFSILGVCFSIQIHTITQSLVKWCHPWSTNKKCLKKQPSIYSFHLCFN